MANLIFPQFSGWLQVQTGYFQWKRKFFVLCSGRLYYYDNDWRQIFHNGYVNQREKKFPITLHGNVSFKISNLTLKAATAVQRNRWVRELKNIADNDGNIARHIDACNKELTNASSETIADVLDWVMGILTILKDAKTKREDIGFVGNYLAKSGFISAIVQCYKFALNHTGRRNLTSDILDLVNSTDDCEDGDKILYITRRLIWRLAFASKSFALAVTHTDYLHHVVMDLKQILLSPVESWKDGNYLLFSSLDVIQQCARSGVKKTRLYEFGGVFTIASILNKTSSNKIKLASYMALSHMVKEEDSKHLKINEEFVVYLLDLLRKAIPNVGHNVTVDKNTGYYTEVLELFDCLDGLCTLEDNRKLIFDKGIINSLADVTRNCAKADLTDPTIEAETLSTLRLIDHLCYSVYAKRALQANEIITTNITRLTEVQNNDIKECAKVAQSRIHAVELPRVLLRLDEETIAMYKNALKYGTTPDRHVRVMVVGHKGAGKTSLCRRLLNEDIDNVDSTEGIDLYIQRILVDIVTLEWRIQNKGAELDGATNRLAKVMSDLYANKQTHTAEVNISEHSENWEECLGERDTQHHHSWNNTEEDTEDEDNDDEFFDALDTLSVEQAYSSVIPLSTMEQVFQMHMTQTFDIGEHCSMSLFDFAGEQIYYATHQIFLAPECVFLIVIDLSEASENNNCVVDEARFWLRSILEYSAIKIDREGDPLFKCPPVLLIGTHKDKLKFQTDKEKESFGLHILQRVVSVPELECVEKESFARIYVTDNTIIDPTTAEIKVALLDAARSQDKWERPIPTKWLSLENELMKRKSNGEKLIDFESLCKINDTVDSPLEKDEILAFLKYLHAEGLVLYFEGCELQNWVIIDLQWIIDAFKSIITTEKAMSRLCSPRLSKMKMKLETEAKLYREYVEEILNNFNLDLTSSQTEVLLLYMIKLNLISKPPRPCNPADYWIVPCMLSTGHLSSILDMLHLESHLKTCALCLDMQSSLMPNSVSCQLMAACIAKWQLVYLENKCVLFKNVAAFQIDICWRLLIHIDDDLLQAVMYRYTKKDDIIPPGQGIDVRIYLESVVKSVISRHQINARIRSCIQCRLKPKKKSKPVVCTALVKYKELQCCEGTEDQLHTIGISSMQHWFEMKNFKIDPLNSKIAHLEFSHFPDFPGADKAVSQKEEYPPFPKMKVHCGTDNRRDVHQGQVQKTGRDLFLKECDDSFTETELKALLMCCESVGQLHSVHGTSTVFRVGANLVMTTYHSIEPIIVVNTFQGFDFNVNNLHQENVYVVFSEQKRFHIQAKLEAFDPELDYAILELCSNLFPLGQVLPCPLIPLSVHKDADRLAAVIGFGHTKHDERTIDPHVAIIPKHGAQMLHAGQWVRDNQSGIENCLKWFGKDEYVVADAYSVLEKAGKICLSSILEKGGSGAPGILLTPMGPRVFMMLQGGLPSFFWDLPPEWRRNIPFACRTEYGTTMVEIKKHIEARSLDLKCAIYGI